LFPSSRGFGSSLDCTAIKIGNISVRINYVRYVVIFKTLGIM